jgi:hypothetical protein
MAVHFYERAHPVPDPQSKCVPYYGLEIRAVVGAVFVWQQTFRRTGDILQVHQKRDVS